MKSAIDEYGVFIIEIIIGCVMLLALFILAGLIGGGSVTIKGVAQTVANYICP